MIAGWRNRLDRRNPRCGVSVGRLLAAVPAPTTISAPAVVPLSGESNGQSVNCSYLVIYASGFNS
jgi:hypothetical protein